MYKKIYYVKKTLSEKLIFYYFDYIEAFFKNQ